MAVLAAFMVEHVRAAGIVGPRLVNPDGTGAALAARVSLPSAGRSSAARPSAAPPALKSVSASTTAWTNIRRSRSRRTGCSAGRSSSAAKCSTSSAGTTRASECTARRSTSATALRRPGGSAGTSPRRSSPTAGTRSPTSFLTRRTLWHWRLDPPLRAQASRDDRRPLRRVAIRGTGRYGNLRIHSARNGSAIRYSPAASAQDDLVRDERVECPLDARAPGQPMALPELAAGCGHERLDGRAPTASLSAP